MSSSQILRRCPALGGITEPEVLFDALLSLRGAPTEKDRELSLSGLLSPELMSGCSDAATILAQAITENQRILVVGDFDADGATSSALAVSALKAFGARNVDYLVPNRFEYGYGLSPEIVEVARERAPDVLVTVDNGISSLEGVALARSFGWQVIVTDHHLAPEILPDASVIVNPNQPDCPFPSKALAGVGVMFYVLVALRGALRASNYFDRAGLVEPNLAEWLDLVAVGSVADLVPLDRNNRILVEQGLRRIRAGLARPGIQALLKVAGRSNETLVAQDIGFALGPRINAAGRLDDMSIGIRCLLASDQQEAEALAQELDTLNRDRRSIEQTMKDDAERALERLGVHLNQVPSAIVLFDPSWHQGVVGIVASRMKERFNRPCIIFASGEHGELKGSARSIEGLHIRDALDLVVKANPGLILKFGGHAMAAGLTIPASALDEFSLVFESTVETLVNEEMLEATQFSDGELNPRFFELPFARQLRVLQPWGQKFPEPVFDGFFRVHRQRVVGLKHVKLSLMVDGLSTPLDAIAFNADLSLYEQSEGTVLRMAYRLDVNEFRGLESLQLVILYAEKVKDIHS
jgi:single-stranded-DNA-specific exonuclease